MCNTLKVDLLYICGVKGKLLCPIRRTKSKVTTKLEL